jgi:hypothetical protein
MARAYGEPKDNIGAPEAKRQDPQVREAAPDAEAVRRAHKNASVDTKSTDIHHTLGPGRNQASPGAHLHDGSDSRPLLEGRSITGVKGTLAWYNSINSLFVALGATDSSS